MVAEMTDGANFGFYLLSSLLTNRGCNYTSHHADFLLERFSIDLRKSQTKAITEPITSDYDSRKHMKVSFVFRAGVFL